MLDDKKESKELIPETKKEILDPASAISTIKSDQLKIVQDIISASSRKELQEYIDNFNLSQTKKNALRVMTLSDILDKAEDQANQRFTKRPDEISNRELLEFIQVVSTQIDRSQKALVDVLEEKKPLIQINTQNNENNTINIAPKLNREKRENVIDAVTELIKSINNANASVEINNETNDDSDVIVASEYEISSGDSESVKK